MSRKKHAQAVHGWVLVDKPAGLTSRAAVNQIERFFNAQKAGHAGTLDPDATGLLPVALGEATKLLYFLENAPKTYRFAVNWGAETTTDDAAGEMITHTDKRPQLEDIASILPKFTGDIFQTPPRVSAVKIDGKRAYAKVRAGEDFTPTPRPLHVARLEILQHTPDQTQFEMSCGKGGYVRAMARDLGRELGCLGFVAWLRRTQTIGFDVEAAQNLDQAPVLLPLDQTPLLEQIEISHEAAQALRQGRIAPTPILPSDRPFLAICDETPVAVAMATPSGLQSLRGLNILNTCA